ncbi:MAG: sugar ABC transporter substrate-binding protein [Rubellimicrobium sp.]|nr:sugar ABC transporter substrate-binding protein [Rubellimicrobium sp.]
MTRKLLAAALAATALTPAAVFAEGDAVRLAFLAASSQNGYNDATWQGIQAAAAEDGNVEVEIFDGEFNATVQFSQVEDIVAGGRFDGIIIAPNDTVGIATALEEATSAGLLVASVLFPVGPELTNMEPQVPGLTTTVALDPAAGARAEAEAVVDYCADKDPCRVVIMIGQLQFPFDNLRYESFLEVLNQHANITVVATGEGNYNPDQSLTAMTDILQANPEIDVVLSNADQHLLGVEIALEDAGIDPASVYTIGGGLNQITVDKIRAGVFDATLSGYPRSEGYIAAQLLIRAARGEEVPTWASPAEGAANPLIVTKEWLDANPDFTAEWEG